MDFLIPVGLVANKSLSIVENGVMYYKATHFILLSLEDMNEYMHKIGTSLDYRCIVQSTLHEYSEHYISEDLKFIYSKYNGNVTINSLYDRQVLIRLEENGITIKSIRYGRTTIRLLVNELRNIHIYVDTVSKTYKIQYSEDIMPIHSNSPFHRGYVSIETIKWMFERFSDNVARSGDIYIFYESSGALIIPEECKIAIIMECSYESIRINPRLEKILFYTDSRPNLLIDKPQKMYLPKCISEEVLSSILISLISGNIIKNNQITSVIEIKARNLFDYRQYSDMLELLRAEDAKTITDGILTDIDVKVY